GLLRGAEIRAIDGGNALQAGKVRAHRLIVERPLHVVVVRYGLEAQQLAESGKALDPGEARGRNVALKLQQLEFDFQEIALAHVAHAKALVADVHGFLKALQVLLRELKCRLRQQHVHKLLADVVDQLALAVGNERARQGGLVPGGLQAMLALLATLEEVADARVKLRLLIDVIGTELAGLENGQELRVETQRGIGAKVGGNLFRQALLDGRAQGLQRMVMLQRHTDGIVQRNSSGHRRCCAGLRRRGSRSGRGALLSGGKSRQEQQRENQKPYVLQRMTPHVP